MPKPTPPYNPLFDTYLPVPPPACPECGLPMEKGQGTDGPSLLLDWRQGNAAPIDQRIEEQSDDWQSERLPAVFEFGVWCPRGHYANARGEVRDGVWSSTTLLPDT